MTSYTAILIPVDPTEPITTLKIGESGSTLSDLQAAVGGYIEAAAVDREDISLYVNEEGKLQGLPCNVRADRLWHQLLPGAWDSDYLAGPAVLIGFDPEDGENADLPADLLEQLLGASGI